MNSGADIRHDEVEAVCRRRVEDDHGSFEHEYFAREYLDHLRSAGFEPYRAPAAGGFRTPLQRALLRPPLAWLNGVLFSEFTYVGRRPA